jgi:hypothetical protein
VLLELTEAWQLRMYSAKADSEHYIITPLSVKFMEFNDVIASRYISTKQKIPEYAGLILMLLPLMLFKFVPVAN